MKYNNLKSKLQVACLQEQLDKDKGGETMHKFIYRGARTKEISFPLGGIGTGCIGLAGNGQLIDWEIFNRPNKKSMNGFSHFAIKAESNGKMLDVRVLNGDMLAPYTGKQLDYKGSLDLYGFGPARSLSENYK